VKKAFGEHARRLCISSTKSAHGHAFGGAGGIELVATTLAMKENVAPPTVNFLGPDEQCDLDYVPNCARERRIDAALSQSFAFGGLNAVLALKTDCLIMKLRRVAVTGMGVISSIGRNVNEFRASLATGRSGIGSFAPDHETWPPGSSYAAAPVLCPVDDPAFEFLNPTALDRTARLAIVATREALTNAGIKTGDSRLAEAAVVMGTAVGGDHSRDVAGYRVFGRGLRPHPFVVVQAMVNAVTSAICMAFQCKGPAFTVGSACAASNHAISQAFRMVQTGQTNLAVTGGAESLPAYSLYRAWQQLRVLSPIDCNPFAANRNGLVLGEGAGVLVLEPLEGAIANGTPVHGEIAGIGMSSDASDWVHPDPDGMLRCMRNALEDADCTVAGIGYVNAHGTGTVKGDRCEAEALMSLFRDSRPPLSSTKCLHGHALGASGALEAIASLLALDAGCAPAMPTAPADPSISLNLVRGRHQLITGRLVLSASFGFGGLNAAIVLRNVRGETR
jgi:nodulation protein E